MAKTYDVDEGSIEITGNHPENPNEKPVSVPVDGDDGQPVQQEPEFVEKEPITIVTETEKKRIDDETENRGAKKDPIDAEAEEAENDEDDDVTRELKRQRNRARRDANKERRRQAAEYKNSEIRRLRQEVEELRANQNASSHLSKLDADQQQIQRFKDDAATKFMLAEKKLSEAFKNGDAEAHTTAMKEMYDAKQSVDRAESALNVIAAKKKEPIQTPEPEQDSFVQEMAAEFQKKNSWFDARLADRDSRRAKRISEDLLREGYSPSDEEYWEELNDRIADEIPHRAVREREEEKEIEKSPAPKKLPISAGGGREVKASGGDGRVAASDITSMQRSILRQMGYVEGTKEWLEMALEYKKKNRSAQGN